MCGIFGVVKKVPLSMDERVAFYSLAHANKRRGTHGFGMLVLFANGAKVVIRTTSFEKLETCIYTYYNMEIPVVGLLGHSLTPTNGDSVTTERCHPLERHGIYLAHNGILLNVPQGAHDTRWLLERVSEGPSKINFYALNGVEGAHACWCVSGTDVYLWRAISPLHVTFDNGLLKCSSVPLEGVKGMVSEGVVYHLEHDSLVQVSRFEVNNPYLV